MKVLPQAHLLVIDDEAHAFNLLRAAFREASLSIELSWFGAGAASLSQLRSRAGAAGSGGPAFPDLILLDLAMPPPDGLEVLRILKEDAALAQIPVVVLTASERPATVADVLKLGAYDFRPKPSSYLGYLGLAHDILGILAAYRSTPSAEAAEPAR